MATYTPPAHKPRISDCATKLPSLCWEDDHILDSLERVYLYAIATAEESIRYYAKSAGKKKYWARRLRALQIVLLTIAGILPLLSQLAEQYWTVSIAPAWATVVLGVAGGLLLLDKFFGTSRAWARFTETGLKTEARLAVFEIEWQRLMVDLAVDDEPKPKKIRAMLDLAAKFVTKVEELITTETRQWIKEFNESQREIDSMTDSFTPVNADEAKAA